jgi:hypothetical protein
MEYSGRNFWELVAEQTNLQSVHDTLFILKTTDSEIIHLTRFEFLIRAHNFYVLNYTAEDYSSFLSYVKV